MTDRPGLDAAIDALRRTLRDGRLGDLPASVASLEHLLESAERDGWRPSADQAAVLRRTRTTIGAVHRHIRSLSRARREGFYGPDGRPVRAAAGKLDMRG
ncbi:MAG: hypothetical protein ACU0BS_10590 [Hasllibacter sp.]